MMHLVGGEDRRQPTMLLSCRDDYVAEKNPIRVSDVFVDELAQGASGFSNVIPAATGRLAYHPGMLKNVKTEIINLRIPTSI